MGIEEQTLNAKGCFVCVMEMKVAANSAQATIHNSTE